MTKRLLKGVFGSALACVCMSNVHADYVIGSFTIPTAQGGCQNIVPNATPVDGGTSVQLQCCDNTPCTNLGTPFVIPSGSNNVCENFGVTSVACGPSLSQQCCGSTTKSGTMYTVTDCNGTSTSQCIYDGEDGAGVCTGQSSTAIKAVGAKEYNARIGNTRGYTRQVTTTCGGSNVNNDVPDTCVPVADPNNVCSGANSQLMECKPQNGGSSYTICETTTSTSLTAKLAEKLTAADFDSDETIIAKVNELISASADFESKISEMTALKAAAEAAKDAALAAKAAAETAKDTATERASAAATSASNAGDSATAAASSATTASNKAEAAATSATNAENSATAADASKKAAATSETNAGASAEAAAGSATNAATSETNAGKSAATASEQATLATNKANAAQTAQTAAEAAKADAETAKSGAEAARVAAETASSAIACPDGVDLRLRSGTTDIYDLYCLGADDPNGN